MKNIRKGYIDPTTAHLDSDEDDMILTYPSGHFPQWFAEHPEHHDLVRRFPPGCRVRPTKTACHLPVDIGRPLLYSAPNEQEPEGHINVLFIAKHEDEPNARASFLPNDLELVGYGRIKPEDVESK